MITRTCRYLVVALATIVPGQYAEAQQQFPVAGADQVAAALRDCLTSGGRPNDLKSLGWHPETPSPSTSGMRNYLNRTNPAWMPVPDRPGGSQLCWITVRTTVANPRAEYERSISAVVKATPRIGPKDSEWITPSHVIVMDWFAERGMTGLRIEVHRAPR